MDGTAENIRPETGRNHRTLFRWNTHRDAEAEDCREEYGTRTSQKRMRWCQLAWQRAHGRGRYLRTRASWQSELALPWVFDELAFRRRKNHHVVSLVDNIEFILSYDATVVVTGRVRRTSVSNEILTIDLPRNFTQRRTSHVFAAVGPNTATGRC